GRPDVSVADRVVPAGAVRDDELDPDVAEDPFDLAQAFLVRYDGLVEDERAGVQPATRARLADPAAVNREVDRHLQCRQHLRPDHFAAALPRTETHSMHDRPA